MNFTEVIMVRCNFCFCGTFTLNVLLLVPCVEFLGHNTYSSASFYQSEHAKPIPQYINFEDVGDLYLKRDSLLV